MYEENVTLQFCVIADLGLVPILLNGTEVNSSISYTKIHFSLVLDMTAGFARSVDVSEDVSRVNQELNTNFICKFECEKE